MKRFILLLFISFNLVVNAQKGRPSAIHIENPHVDVKPIHPTGDTKPIDNPNRKTDYYSTKITYQNNLIKPEFSPQYLKNNSYFITDVLPKTNGDLQVSFKTNISQNLTDNFFDLIESKKHNEFPNSYVFDYEKIKYSFTIELIKKLGKNCFVLFPDGTTKKIYCEENKVYYDYEKFRLEIPESLVTYDIYKSLNMDLPKTENLLISLISNDSFTENMIEKMQKNGEAAIIKNGEDELINMLKTNKNRNIYTLGHIENGYYVSKDHNDNVKFSIDIKRIREFEKNNALSIFILGCSSIKNYSTAGHSHEVKSDDMVNIIKSCFKAKTLKDIYNTLSSEEKGYKFYVSGEHVGDRINFTARIHSERASDNKENEKNDIRVNSIAYSQIFKQDLQPEPSPPNPDDSSNTIIIFLYCGFVVFAFWIAAVILDYFGEKK